MKLSEGDHALVSAAVTAAEAHTDGEIVVIAAARSDAYHDVGLHWAVVAMLGWLALLAVRPGIAERAHGLVEPWTATSPTAYLTVALIGAALVFLAVRLLLVSMRARLMLTPGTTEARRVRRRATELFRASAEHRTRAKTGVLLYLSLAEHRAEIVADEAIHSRVQPEVWGEAMAALVASLHAGRPGEGIAAAVERIGTVLAGHFPRSADDVNELPDRLVEL